MCCVYTVGTNLHSGFGEVRLHGDLFAGVDVRVVRLGKRLFQLLELSARERGADTTLLPLLWTDRRRVDVVVRRVVVVVVVVHIVRQSGRRCMITRTPSSRHSTLNNRLSSSSSRLENTRRCTYSLLYF